MNTITRHSLVAAVLLMCFWTPSYAGHGVNAKDKRGDTALIRAARVGHADRIKALIAAGADVNAKDEDGITALMQAAFYTNADIVKALIAAGADVNARDKNGKTALMLAATTEAGGQVRTVQTTAAEAAAENANVVIGGAVQVGWPDCVEALVAAGADLNAKDTHGKTALALAQSARSGCVAILRAAGAR